MGMGAALPRRGVVGPNGEGARSCSRPSDREEGGHSRPGDPVPSACIPRHHSESSSCDVRGARRRPSARGVRSRNNGTMPMSTAPPPAEKDLTDPTRSLSHRKRSHSRTCPSVRTSYRRERSSLDLRDRAVRRARFALPCPLRTGCRGARGCSVNGAISADGGRAREVGPQSLHEREPDL